MASKRATSKDTVESSIGEAIEQVSLNFLVNADTHLFIEKGFELTWQEIKDIFAGDFNEDLEDQNVYVNIHWPSLHKVACRYPTFPCVEIIHWIISHTDSETMTLISASGTQLATFRMKN